MENKISDILNESPILNFAKQSFNCFSGDPTIPRIIVSPRTASRWTKSPYFVSPRTISPNAEFPVNTFLRVTFSRARFLRNLISLSHVLRVSFPRVTFPRVTFPHISFLRNLISPKLHYPEISFSRVMFPRISFPRVSLPSSLSSNGRFFEENFIIFWYQNRVKNVLFFRYVMLSTQFYCQKKCQLSNFKMVSVFKMTWILNFSQKLRQKMVFRRIFILENLNKKKKFATTFSSFSFTLLLTYYLVSMNERVKHPKILR
jgi:hypothetical protein